MTEPVTLPPLPNHPEPHTYVWTKLELEEIRAYGKKCFQAGRKQAIEAERERVCAAIKAEDDHCAEGDYMLDSDDCIKVVRGTWERPDWDGVAAEMGRAKS